MVDAQNLHVVRFVGQLGIFPLIHFDNINGDTISSTQSTIDQHHRLITIISITPRDSKVPNLLGSAPRQQIGWFGGRVHDKNEAVCGRQKYGELDALNPLSASVSWWTTAPLRLRRLATVSQELVIMLRPQLSENICVECTLYQGFFD